MRVMYVHMAGAGAWCVMVCVLCHGRMNERDVCVCEVICRRREGPVKQALSQAVRGAPYFGDFFFKFRFRGGHGGHRGHNRTSAVFPPGAKLPSVAGTATSGRMPGPHATPARPG